MQQGPKSQSKLVGVALLVTFGLFAAGSIPMANADHLPADKAVASGSAMEILGTPATEGSTSETVDLLSATVRSSNTIDLLLQVTLECALWTDITVIGNDESEAIATVNVWIEIDGVPVPVASEGEEEPGKVVFCNRAFKMATMNVDDEDQQIDQYLSTKAANSFNWMQVNVGSGVHEIVVKGELEAQVTGVGEAQAGIGKRTLIVEPLRLSNHVVV